MSEFQHQQVIDLHKKGETYRNIARIVGVSCSSVRNIVIKYKVLVSNGLLKP